MHGKLASSWAMPPLERFVNFFLTLFFIEGTDGKGWVEWRVGEG